jgi:hypothetical protein
MSAATSARAPVQRSASAAAPRPAAAQQPARTPVAFDEPGMGRLNLSDIPAISESMDVEGFKPSLLSRLMGLFAR